MQLLNNSNIILKKIYTLFWIGLLLIHGSVLASSSYILDVDFMQSMTDGSAKAKELLIADPAYAHYLQVFEENYVAKMPSKMEYQDKPLIPKVMHHVWIGGGDIPPLYQNYLNECKKLHPDWEFKIWGDKEVAELGLEYQDVYDKTRLYPGKTDILRFEIVNRFGGVYRDMDIKCYKPIDDLNHKYELYTSLEYPGVWQRPAINTGLLAAKAGHPMLKPMLDNLRQNIDSKYHDFDNGFESYSTKNIQLLGVDVFMLPFTDVFINNVSLSDKNIAFPATYFMPLSYSRYEAGKIAKAIYKIIKTPGKMSFEFIKPESLMWHNILKNEITYIDFGAANGMTDPSRKRLFKSLGAADKQKYKIFNDIYNSNNTAKVSWSKQSKTPQVINFVIFDQAELSELSRHLPEWEMFNRDFEIKVWDRKKIIDTFATLEPLFSDNTSENLRFYIALKVLEKFGGNYAYFGAKPHISIFEMSNKYNFYAGLAPIHANELLLSQKLMGATAGNPIVSKTLAQIDPLDGVSLNKVSEVFTLMAYQNIYLNGKNIVLPAMYLGFKDPVEDDYLHFIQDRVIRFFKNIPKSFTEVNGYSIVE